MSWLDQIGGALGNAAGWVGNNAAGLGTTALGAGLMGAGFFDGGTTVSSGAQIGAAGLGMLASKSAADTQANAATQAAQIQADQNQRGLDFQRQALTQQQQNAQPWMQAGQGAVGQIQQLNNAPNFGMSDFQQDPGYAFRLSQGMDQLQASAAARGGLMSGNTLKGISDYAQQSASQEYQNAFSRYQDQRQQRLNSLGQVAGLGSNNAMGLGQGIQNAGNNASNIAMNTGQALASGMTGAANANAAGMMSAANALSSGVSGAINYNQSNNLLNALRPHPADPTPTDTSHMFDMSGTGEGNIPTQFGNSIPYSPGMTARQAGYPAYSPNYIPYGSNQLSGYGYGG